MNRLRDFWRRDRFNFAWWTRWRQDVRVLIRLFPWSVAGILFVGIAVLARIYQYTYNQVESPAITYTKAIFAALNMALFQLSYADMPTSPLLDPFFVIAPLIGIPLFLVFGANIIQIIRVFFVRAERGQMWQQALADTVEKPIIICGLGRIGYRVAQQLLDFDQPVVGIDAQPSPLIDTLLERNMPVILGDVRNADVLRSVGVARASIVLICTDLDLVNIEAAFHVREMNPKARLVLRLFEDEIADEIQKGFDIKSVLSRSAIAAQAFAHAAIGLEILETFNLGEQPYFLAKIPLTCPVLYLPDVLPCGPEDESTNPPPANLTVQTLMDAYRVTFICLQREEQLIVEPPPETILHVHDVSYVFGRAQQLTKLSEYVGHTPDFQPGPILVCGLGHTGYRVVKALLALGHSVIALDLEPGRLAERLQALDVPLLMEDFRQPAVLERAGIRQASALIACTEDDMANFETVLRARELNPHIRVVMRIFEEALGKRLQQMFDIDVVYSTSAIAAPVFVTAALQVHAPQPVYVGGEQHFIVRAVVAPLSNLIGIPIKVLQAEEGLTVLLHIRTGQAHIPSRLGHTVLTPGDEIVVLVSESQLHRFQRRTRPLKELR